MTTAPLRVVEPLVNDKSRRSAQRSGPQLSVVPGRRRATRYVVSITTVIALAMGGVVFLNTQIAGRQVRINEIKSQLSDEQERFDELRSARAQLRAPQRLEPLATELGMVATEEAGFAEVDPMVYARQIALNGRVPTDSPDGAPGLTGSDPMEQMRAVKELLEGAP